MRFVWLLFTFHVTCAVSDYFRKTPLLLKNFSMHTKTTMMSCHLQVREILSETAKKDVFR